MVAFENCFPALSLPATSLERSWHHHLIVGDTVPHHAPTSAHVCVNFRYKPGRPLRLGLFAGTPHVRQSTLTWLDSYDVSICDDCCSEFGKKKMGIRKNAHSSNRSDSIGTFQARNERVEGLRVHEKCAKINHGDRCVLLAQSPRKRPGEQLRFRLG